MSVRNLEALFQPASVALVGASDREGSLGAVVLRNLKLGGFKGVIWPVNHRHATVDGMQAWPDVASLPQVPDLAVICTPVHLLVLCQISSLLWGVRAHVLPSLSLQG